MDNLLNKLLIRIKKSIPLIIILPLLLGGLGYFFEKNSKPVVSYAAKTKIELGYYDDPNMNSPESVKTLLSGYSFLESVFPAYQPEDLEDIKSGLVINTVSNSAIDMTYRSDNEEEVEKVSNELVEAFLTYDNEKYEEKASILEDSFQTLSDETVSEDSKVDKQRFIYELQNELLTLYPSQLSEPVRVNEYRQESFSAKKRAVLGGLVGLTFVFAYIVVPILFREDEM
ncbi:hypothetical protein AB685_08030 [Bacillus sp. LL01]|uniref:hypothetical protein n=1 Tax=Bacillus sp. LL01 TaxID=1665556 RepID=UPI00064D6C48|nr:hypothetical protein [Bacillus sp. LL01]KMJ59013.1 hypothetical protein AB685_08030 [Bacillus sp. LL01]